MRWMLSVVLVTASLAGCGEDDPVLWQGHSAEAMRELWLLDAPEVRRFSREEWSARAAASADNISDATLQYHADTYGRLGFFDMNLDLRPVFAGSSSDWVGATYSPGSNVISLIGEARDDTIVHEYVHALQDDHYDIAAYDLQTSDGFLARRSVVEGDAVVATLRFVAQREVGGDLDAVAWQPLFEARREFTDETLADAEYPVVFLDYVSLVYTYGFEYMARNLTGAQFGNDLGLRAAPYDWGLANQMFTDRFPETTEQILELDLLYQPADDDPVVDVGMRAVPTELAGEVDSVDWDQLGRWFVYLLLYPLEQQGSVDATTISRGWDGDTALFVRDPNSGAMGVIWVAEWDDAAIAQSAVEALRLVQGFAPNDPATPYIGSSNAGENAWIERRGNRTLMMLNVSSAVENRLAELAFGSSTAMVRRRYPSLAETLHKAHRAAGHHRCATVSHRLRQSLHMSAAPQKK